MSSANSISRHAIMGYKTEKLTYTVSTAANSCPALSEIVNDFGLHVRGFRIPLASASQILFSSLKHFHRIIYTTTFRLRAFFSNSDVLGCLKNCILNNVSQKKDIRTFCRIPQVSIGVFLHRFHQNLCLLINCFSLRHSFIYLIEWKRLKVRPSHWQPTIAYSRVF